MKYYAGLDVSSKLTFICIVNDSGDILYESSVATDPDCIAKSLKRFKHPLCEIGLESGSLSYWLTRELKERNINAILIDSRQMATFLALKVNKTDKNDARAIAEAMRCKAYKQISLKSKKSIETGVIMSARRTLVKQRVELKNSVRGLLKAYGIRLGSVSEAKFSEKVNDYLEGFSDEVKRAIKSLLIAFDAISSELNKTNENVEKISRKDKDIALLKTIPGVGTITAMTFKAEIDDPTRFEDPRDVAAYFGLTPTQYSSGESIKQGCISKAGSGSMRTLLIEAAIVMLTRSSKWSRLKIWGLKLMKRKGLMKAATAVARKLAIVMYMILREQTEFRFGAEELAA